MPSLPYNITLRRHPTRYTGYDSVGNIYYVHFDGSVWAARPIAGGRYFSAGTLAALGARLEKIIDERASIPADAALDPQYLLEIGTEAGRACDRAEWSGLT